MTTTTPEDQTVAKRLSAYGGTYERDEQGVWRYAHSGEPVPGATDLREGRRIVGIHAPELAPMLLASVKDVMAHYGWSGGTLSTYISRGYFPPATVRIGDCNAWPWPVVRDYKAVARHVAASR